MDYGLWIMDYGLWIMKLSINISRSLYILYYIQYIKFINKHTKYKYVILSNTI